MGKLTDLDWWLGRTDEQRRRKDAAKSELRDVGDGLRAARQTDEGNQPLGRRISRLGWTLTLVVTFPLVGVIVGGFVGLAVGLVVGFGLIALRR